ncbi:MAG: FAD-binding protein, partial [Oscillospiraceae bacterium]|nr:FAD-binding protein [Oscillospiraceae bacterium]
MLKLSNIRLAERCGDSELRSIAAGILGISEELIETLRIHRLSTDARRKPDVRFVYTLLATVSDEQAVLAKLGTLKNARKGAPGGQSCIGRNISLYDPPERYVFPVPYPENIAEPLVIVGMGPAGLFAALCLAEAGVKCVVLERGQPVEERIASVLRFWREGRLDEASNVQFGEGGAGTFSDGKLTTSINDKRIQFVLEQLVRFGAPDDILYLAKPHIGTDRLRDVVVAMRKRLLELGCDLRFGHRLVDIEISGGALCGALVQVGAETYTISTHRLVLAPGNSSRDTFEILSRRGVSISPKGFSVGVRIEHLQRDIDCAQYGDAAVSVAATLPASDYKLVEHLDNGRSV